MSDEPKNTVLAGFGHGFKRVSPAKLADDIRDGDRKYIAGYVFGYVLKLGLIVAGAYFGIDLTAAI